MIFGLGLVMVVQLVLQCLMGFIMGSWFLIMVGVNIIGGYVVNLMVVLSDVIDLLMFLEVYGCVFMQIGIVIVVIVVLMLLIVFKLNCMIQDDDIVEKGFKVVIV